MKYNYAYDTFLKIKEILEDELIDDSNNLLLTPFNLPSALGGGSFGLVMPNPNFYYQIVIILLLQTSVAALLAIPLYHFIIIPQREKKMSITDLSTSFLVGVGVVFPILLYEPVMAIEYFNVKSVAIRMLYLSLPITGSLRCMEVLAGNTPPGAKNHLQNFVLYFSCLMGVSFTKEEKLIRISSKYLVSQVAKLIWSYFVIIPLLSYLKANDYMVFQTGFEADSVDHSFLDLLSWKHLLNNYMNALLLSVSLSQSTLGVSIIYNCLFGYETIEVVQNPMLKSKSPSDFWGRRWNILIHTLLKRSTFKPVRKYFSRTIAVLATFFVSGLLHEYVNIILLTDIRDSVKWKNMIFFLWNGFIIFVESIVGNWMIFQWVGQRVPGFIITALVILTALPLAHLFLGEYIVGGFFDHVCMANPRIIKHSD